MGRVTFKQIPVGKLVVAAENMRRLRTPTEADAALRDSVRALGVLVPLIVQPDGKRFGVLAGKRRLAAAKAAGLAAVPCVVREANGTDARVVSTTENTLREDFAPLEEAEILAKLLKAHESVTALATALGRSEAYIYGRLALQRLVPVAQRALNDGTMPLAQALELARCGPADQERLLPDATTQTLKGLRADIAGLRIPLRQAPWDLADAKLVAKAGACDGCPFRTGTQPALFADCGPDLCTNRACFRGKGKATIERLRQERPDLRLLYPDTHGGENPIVEGTSLAPWEWKLAKATAKGAAEGVLVAGPRAGTIVWFVRTGEATKAAPASRGDAEAKLRRQYLPDLIRAAWERITSGKDGFGLLADALLERLGGDDRRTLAKVWDKGADVLRGQTGTDPVAPLRDAIKRAESATAARHVLERIAVAAVLGRAAGFGGKPWDRAVALVEDLGLDVAAGLRAFKAGRESPKKKDAAAGV